MDIAIDTIRGGRYGVPFRLARTPVFSRVRPSIFLLACLPDSRQHRPQQTAVACSLSYDLQAFCKQMCHLHTYNA